jgi:hypothetical protein
MSAICELVSCEAIQQTLDTAFGYDNMAPENLGTLAYVFSPENVNAAQVTAVTGRPSKVNPVKVIWDQRFTEDEIEEGRGGCSMSDTICDLSTVYNFDTTVAYHKGFAVDALDLAGTCEENSSIIARKVAKLINLADIHNAKLLADAIAAQYGRWSVDTANGRGVAVSGNILQVNDYLGPQNGGGVNPVLMQQIRKALQKSRIEGGIVSGGDALDDYFQRSFTRNNSSLFGWDITEMVNRYGFAPVYDRYLADALAAVNATNAAIGRGGVVPLVFNLFAEQFNKMNDSTNIADVVFSPNTGIPYDLIIHRPCPTDPWNVSISTSVDFVTMPDELYKATDNLFGVKNLALLNVTCEDLAPCQAEA